MSKCNYLCTTWEDVNNSIKSGLIFMLINFVDAVSEEFGGGLIFPTFPRLPVTKSEK